MRITQHRQTRAVRQKKNLTYTISTTIDLGSVLRLVPIKQDLQNVKMKAYLYDNQAVS